LTQKLTSTGSQRKEKATLQRCKNTSLHDASKYKSCCHCIHAGLDDWI
jgi:hypothetical protein